MIIMAFGAQDLNNFVSGPSGITASKALAAPTVPSTPNPPGRSYHVIAFSKGSERLNKNLRGPKIPIMFLGRNTIMFLYWDRVYAHAIKLHGAFGR